MKGLRTKDRFSPTQLAVLIAASGIGSQIILAPHDIIHDTLQHAWISVLLGGFLYFAATYLQLMLARRYASESLTAYLPRLMGKPLGILLLIWYVFIHLGQLVLVLRGFSRVIGDNMFSRTPEEAIATLFLALITYGALQSWGVIIRIQQYLLLTSVPLLFLYWLASFLNFQADNLLPVFPLKPALIAKDALLTWNFYSGYELILLIYPLVYRHGLTHTKAISGAFLIMTFIFTTVIFSTIGTLTAKTAGNLAYPSLTTIKGVEVPGTFVERLELYLLLLWIPSVFDTYLVFYAVASLTLAEYTGYGSHRTWVWILLPFVYGSFTLLDGVKSIETAGQVVTAAGVGFSFIAVPVALLFSWWKERKKRCEGC